MKVAGLDGRQYSLDLRGPVPGPGDESGSSGHRRCRALLARLYPLSRRHEEVSLPGSGALRADFLLAAPRLVVEVHGRQHYEYVGHFHRHPLGFLHARGRDDAKARWCELNDFAYVELPDGDDDAAWEVLLRGARP